MSYSTSEVAAALGTSTKVIDNLLTRDAKHLVGDGRRGRARQIDEPVIEILAVALLLHRDLNTTPRYSVQLAAAIMSSSSFQIAVGALGSLRFDVASLRRVLRTALADAVEDRAPVRRGRPKAKRGASL